jgi:hypothetical protein
VSKHKEFNKLWFTFVNMLLFYGYNTLLKDSRFSRQVVNASSLLLALTMLFFDGLWYEVMYTKILIHTRNLGIAAYMAKKKIATDRLHY